MREENRMGSAVWILFQLRGGVKNWQTKYVQPTFPSWPGWPGTYMELRTKIRQQIEANGIRGEINQK